MISVAAPGRRALRVSRSSGRAAWSIEDWLSNYFGLCSSGFDRHQQKRSMGNCGAKGTSPTPLAEEEAVILVVGNDSEYNSRVAYAIAEARGATEEELTKAGVRIFTRESSPATPVVVDTVPLRTLEDAGRVDNARMWISQNSLRRLCGKFVAVVCVISSTDPEDEIQLEPESDENSFSWLHLLACVFKQHKQKIVMLVNSEDSTDEALRRPPQLAAVLQRDGFKDNITKFFNFGRDDITPTINSILQQSEAGTFFLPEVVAKASDMDKFGPWGPENVIVFGKTGSGKSTFAQMLTSGKLHARSTRFSFGSRIRGETKKVKYGQGRGWRVVDTPGLGESVNDSQSTVPTEKAGRLIREFVMLREGTYSHFIYVWKRDRVDDLDERLWEVFVMMFGAALIKSHMTIVVSDADQEWLDSNIRHLKRCFKGCESFMTASFPPPEEEDDDYGEEVQKLRLDSLKALEDDLASLGRVDTACKLGKWSIGTQRSFTIRTPDDSLTLRPSIRVSPDLGSTELPVHPSDYETARTSIRLKSWSSKVARTSMKYLSQK